MGVIRHTIGIFVKPLFRLALRAFNSLYPEIRNPRHWSNDELRRFAPLFTGTVINVSGWQDMDKQGGRYRDYFTSASDYAISNYSGPRGASGMEGEIFLNLEDNLPEDFRGGYDVVFNHSTMEHIYEVRRAFANLCAISRDIVIIVVPFVYQAHGEPGLSDYWRFTPQAMRRLFKENGFQTIYESACSTLSKAVYLFVVAARDASKWGGKIPEQRLPDRFLGLDILPEESPRVRSVRRWLRRYV